MGSVCACALSINSGLFLDGSGTNENEVAPDSARIFYNHFAWMKVCGVLVMGQSEGRDLSVSLMRAVKRK
jgi:hypothetical protein